MSTAVALSRSRSFPTVAQTLLSRVQEGEREALELLLAELLPLVRGWMIRLVGPGPAADDATQDALMQLTSALPRFRGESRVEYYARRICVRVAYKHYRKRPKETALDLDDAELVHPGSPEQEAITREELQRLYRSLARLSRKRRLAFVLCAIEGLSPEQAAQLAGTTPGAIRSRVMHAKKELARLLGRGGDDGTLP